MGLAERADLIVDFTSVPVGSYILQRWTGRALVAASPLNLMSRATSMRPTRRQRDRSSSSGSCLLVADHHASTVAAPACANAATERGPDATAGAHREGRRRLRRRRQRGRGPIEALLGIVTDDGHTDGRLWVDKVTENPDVGDTEVWRSTTPRQTRTPYTSTS